MRRNKRVQVVEFPYVDPEEVRWVVTAPIPVELPQPYEPAVPEPERKPLPEPKREKVSK